MPKNKKKEDILARKRELEKRRYEKIKNNPELYAKYKEKNKAKYQKRKNEGKVLSINNLTQRDQKMLRRKWREEAKKSYQRKKEEKERIQRFMDCNSPPTSDIENIDVNNIHDISKEKPSTSSDPNSEYKRITRSRSREVSPANSQVSSASSGITPNAQKIVRKLRYKKDKEIASLRLKLQSVIKLNETYRKRISRIRPLQDNNNLHGNVHSDDSEPQVLSSPLAGTCAYSSNLIAEGVLRSYKCAKSFKMKQMISDRLKPHLESSIKDSKYKTQFKNMFRRRMTKNRDTTKKNIVEIFLSGDENSSFTAGKKEFVKKNGVKHQKRYLNDSLANLHKKFTASHSFPLSFATFCRFRPFWILPASKRPRETCLCVIHENFKLLVSALHKYKIIEPKDPTNLIKTICCSEYNPKCLFRDCAECKLRDIEYLAIDNNIDFFYWTWSSKTENVQRNGSEKIIRLVKKEKVITKPNEAVKHFKETLNKYMTHCGKMVNQQKAIKKIKEQLKFDEAVIHIDYSENYKCAYSNEIQSAHFGASKPQITIHTSVLYFYDVNGQKKSQCFATLSSSLRHDTAAVWAHMEPLLDFLKIHCPQANTFHVISDSANSQYRNYKIYFVITALRWNYPELKCVTWNYSESGHGKGAPDGVGAVLKRTADACVSYGTDVPDFESFTLLLKQNLKNIMIETISEYKILEKDMLLPKTLLPFKGTQKVHQIVWCNSNPRSVTLRQLSCTKETCLTKAEYCKHGKHLGFHVVIRDQIETPAPERPRYLRKRLSAVARILDFDSDSDSFTAPSTSIADDLNPNESVTLLHRSRPFSALSEMELPPELRRSTLDKILDEGSTNVTVSPLNSFKHIIDNDSDSDYSIF